MVFAAAIWTILKLNYISISDIIVLVERNHFKICVIFSMEAVTGAVHRMYCVADLYVKIDWKPVVAVFL